MDHFSIIKVGSEVEVVSSSNKIRRGVVIFKNDIHATVKFNRVGGKNNSYSESYSEMSLTKMEK